MSDENTEVQATETTAEKTDAMATAVADRDAALDAVIAGVPEAPAAGTAVIPPLQFKNRKLYNYGSKEKPRLVVSWKSVVYGQPEGFTTVGDRIELAATDDPDYLLDRDGGVWYAEGENKGCGPRCPVSVREMPVGQVNEQITDKVTAEVKVAFGDLCGIAGNTVLAKVWRSISIGHRKPIIDALIAANAAK